MLFFKRKRTGALRFLDGADDDDFDFDFALSFFFAMASVHSAFVKFHRRVVQVRVRQLQRPVLSDFSFRNHFR